MKRHEVKTLVKAFETENQSLINSSNQKIEQLQNRAEVIRNEAISLMQKNNPNMAPSDTNYIFLSFVLQFMPIGLIGLILAMILAASMSSTASELNASASTTVVDIYRRVIKKDASKGHYLVISKLVTFFWDLYAILLAESASRLGSLIEAVNIVGSLFYGTILGIFLVGFYIKSIRGTATFLAAIVSEIIVLVCFFLTGISFLWYNVVGCLSVIIFSIMINPFTIKSANSR